MEGQVALFISPKNRIAQLNPEVPDSLFVASYDLQGYDGGIRTSSTRGWERLVVHVELKVHSTAIIVLLIRVNQWKM
jgi:hypothetical protein